MSIETAPAYYGSQKVRGIGQDCLPHKGRLIVNAILLAHRLTTSQINAIAA
jgi:hypothetical protein